MKVFVTGGSGFIGTNLVTDLIADGAEVVNFDINPPLNPQHSPWWQPGDILDEGGLRKAMVEFHPTHLVHLAARTDTDADRVLDDYRANTEGTANVLRAIAATPSIERTIVTSTQFVCRPGYDPKHDEDYAPHTVYGQSKVITEQLTRKAEPPGAWTIIRPTTIWGPWLMRHKRQVFRVMRIGLYMHPGREPCIRSWGYVGNVTFQIRRILASPMEQVHRKVFYVGDPPLNLYEWADGFSRRLRGKSVRIVPRGVVRAIGRVGDVVGRVGIEFPITSSRYRSMTQDYITPMDETLSLVGELPYSLEAGMDATVAWLERSAA